MSESFEFIRSTFFPMWDRRHAWTFAEEHPDCRGFGLCDTDGKKIVVTPGHPHGDDVTMIHEICHAAASLGHAKKWQRRMEMAAQKAESLGLKDLADGIRKDYMAYNNSLPISACFIYQRLEDDVHDTHGECSFEDAVAETAEYNGTTSEHLLAKFKRLRTVYDNARREAEEDEAIRKARWPHRCDSMGAEWKARLEK